MAYNPSDHPRRPKGTPTGGQFASKAGVGSDNDLETLVEMRILEQHKQFSSAAYHALSETNQQRFEVGYSSRDVFSGNIVFEQGVPRRDLPYRKLSLTYNPQEDNIPYATVQVEDEDEYGITIYHRYQLALTHVTLDHALEDINEVLDTFNSDPKNALPVLQQRLARKQA